MFLMFHDIRDPDPNFFPDRYNLPSFLTIENFRKGLGRLRTSIENFTDINIEKALKEKEHKVFLTFDDGLLDHLRSAQILAEMHIKACFFIPFDAIHDRKVIPSHLIQFLLAAEPVERIYKVLCTMALDHGIENKKLETYKVSRWANNTWSKERVFITRFLREYSDVNLRHNILGSLVSEFISLTEEELSNELYLSPEHVLQIRDMGHEIGSHGCRSLDLRYEVPEIQKDEVFRSKLHCDEILQSKQTIKIAYPNGGLTENSVNIVDDAGYAYGFCTDYDLKLNDNRKNLLIPRVDCGKMDIFHG